MLEGSGPIGSCQPRHAEQRGGLGRGALPAPIVALGRAHLGVPGEALHERQIGPSVEPIIDKRPPNVVRSHIRDLGEAREASEDPRDPRIRERSAGLRCSAFPHRAERRSRSFAAHDDPRLQLGPRPGDVGAALFPALAHHPERPGGAVEIRELERGKLGAMETRDAEHTEQGKIARAAGRC